MKDILIIFLVALTTSLPSETQVHGREFTLRSFQLRFHLKLRLTPAGPATTLKLGLSPRQELMSTYWLATAKFITTSRRELSLKKKKRRYHSNLPTQDYMIVRTATNHVKGLPKEKN